MELKGKPSRMRTWGWIATVVGVLTMVFAFICRPVFGVETWVFIVSTVVCVALIFFGVYLIEESAKKK